MKTDVKQYEQMWKRAETPSSVGKDFTLAFVVGGLICVAGQALSELYMSLGADKQTAGTLVSVTLIALSALFTGVGVYDKLARHAGAGTLVPITGFANAVVSPALEFKTEGFVFGTSAKMFIIAGPVIVWGIFSSAAMGLIFYIAGAL